MIENEKPERRKDEQSEEDVQGHRWVRVTDDDEDDVEGHVQPRRDTDNER